MAVQHENKAAQTSALSEVWAPYLTDQALDRTTRIILEPARYRPRTTEAADVIDDAIRRRVRLELSSGPGPHLVAIASPKRNHLIDLLTITPSSDNMPLVLARQATALFSQLILQRRAISLAIDPSDPAIQVALSVGSLQPIATRSLRGLLANLSEMQGGSEAERAAMETTPALLTLARDDVFMKLFAWFRNSSPLLVPCNPSSGVFVLEFETRSGMREVETRSAPRFLRNLVGLTAYDFEFPARTALFTQSYHFQYRAPIGHYVRSCKVFGSRVGVSRTGQRIRGYAKKEYSPIPPAFTTFADADVDGFAHVQVVNAQSDGNRPRSIVIGIKSSERPPGQFFAALVRWLVVLGVVLFVGSLGSKLVLNQSTLATSLLLVLPGVIGISSLLLSPLETSRIRPFGPQLLSFGAGVASLLATAEFIKWSLHYSDCLRKLQSGGPKKPNLNCSARAPGDISNAYHAIEWLGVAACVTLGLLFVTNLARYLAAERKKPRQRSYIASGEGSAVK